MPHNLPYSIGRVIVRAKVPSRRSQEGKGIGQDCSVDTVAKKMVNSRVKELRALEAFEQRSAGWNFVSKVLPTILTCGCTHDTFKDHNMCNL